ncbi:hypothetical protein RJ639_018768 [Escallonia herrerae]|uniref:CCHC-type domain-containing protein n=1 Tax=Escallonia herrerae TaxID=1293975 RepID=A0AA88VCG0_9ASTE|nr:hypothetical protein RJ639_018768 [Escallonia herrerae]
MAEDGKGKIEKFNGMNFQWWKMQVEDYLYQKDLYLPLVGEKPEAMNASEWAILDRKALATTIGDGISSSTALSVESRGRQNNKQNNRGRSPTRGRSRSRSRGKSKSKGKTIVCWNCNKEGHKKNNCTEPKKKKGAGGRQSDDEGANMVSSNERTYDDLCLSATVDDNSKVWYVDSGASIHCTPHRDCFSNYVHGDYGHVTVGNRYRCSIVGKGKVEIKLSNGGTLVLKDVRHIPELQKNLISISGLDHDASRKTWIYAIRQKSDVYHTFKKWKVLVENETGNKFWAAAVDTAAYLINRSPASALNGGIPEEEWSDNREYMELDEPQVPRTENPEVLDETTDTEIGAGNQQQVPETLNLRRSSRSAIHLAKNSAFHSRTKHIQLSYHFIRSLLEDGQLNLEKIEGNTNPADMLTKVVDRQKLSLCSTLISLR